MSEPACPNCSTPLPESGECPNCATQAFPAAHPSRELHISGYEIVRHLGEGGMGAIYLAEETSLGRRVAIKVISGKLATDTQARARFMREARALATVEHPNVVRVYAFGDVEGHPYLAMEYVDGETLADRIRRTGRLTVDEAIRIVRQILHALDAAWEKGIVHRDIKPSNILIDRRGQVHVVDFGLAKAVEGATDASLTHEGSVLGTPYYLAPEQAQGQPTDFRADVYSCGILLYEMLAGERPFEGTTPLAIVAKHIHEPLPSIRSKRGDVPNKVARLLERMTDKTPAARAGSYEELIAAIDALLGITPAKPISATETFSTIPVARRHGSLMSIATAAVILLVIAAIAFRSRLLKPPDATRKAAGPFVVAVTPFYGPDPDSDREGRLMAAFVERSIVARLGGNVKVIGIDETKSPVRHDDAARQLGERLGASVVVWGEAFALRNETEIQPHFTIIRRAPTSEKAGESGRSARDDVKNADPTAALESQAPPTMRLASEAPNQIDLRKTSAEGVGEMVSLLAGVHALYTENDAGKALRFLESAPKSADSLRYRADAWLQLDEREQAASVLRELLGLQPKDGQAHARLADLDLLGGRFADALAHYRAAAASGQPFTTRYAILHQGELYQRETFQSKEFGTGKPDDTGYLLAVDPERNVVTNRYPMPGIIQSFSPLADGFSVTWRMRDAMPARTLSFRNGRFDKPLVYAGGNLLLRMRGVKSGWVPAANFLGDLMGSIENSPAKARFRLRDKLNPDAPASLPDLEKALRSAIARDPTQPWFLFFLGQTLQAQNRPDEANAAWSEMISRDFPVHYMNWTHMAKWFERLGQREWADRAWERAVRERRRIQQPVLTATLIERLINVPVTRLHPSQLSDPQRAYQWLVRARTLSGITEGDHLAAAAWVAHFRRHGDAGFRAEEEFLKVARAHPFNYTAHAARLDYALDFWIASMFGLFALLVIALQVGDARAVHASGIAPLRFRDRVKLTFGAASPWRAVILALAVSLIIYLAIQIRIDIEAMTDWQRKRVWMGHFAGLLVVLLSLVLVVRVLHLRRIVAQLGRAERGVLLAAFLVALTASSLLFRMVNRQVSLASVQIGFADSIGHPDIVQDFETRLAKRSTAAGVYVAAVANDYAGNRDRAKELYHQLPDDARARRALAALERGGSSPEMPSASELYAAYVAPAQRWPMADTSGFDLPGDFHRVVNLVTLTVLVSTLVVLASFLLIRPPASAAAPPPPRSKSRLTFNRIAMTVIPGYYDIRERSPLTGWIMLVLSGFAACVAFVTPGVLTARGIVGFISEIAMPNYASAFPMPLDRKPIDLALAPPHAALFFSVAIAGVLALLILHAVRLKAIWAYVRSGLDQSETPTLAGTAAPEAGE